MTKRAVPRTRCNPLKESGDQGPLSHPAKGCNSLESGDSWKLGKLGEMSSLGDEQSRSVEASQLDHCKDLSQHVPKHVSQDMPKHSRGIEQSRGVEVSQLAQWRDLSQHILKREDAERGGASRCAVRPVW
mgnify:CR=1 FL=1